MKSVRRVLPFTRLPLFVAMAYAFFGAFWIVTSDGALSVLVPDAETYQYLQTFKGWFFIGVTATLLYITLRAADRRLLDAFRRAVQSEQRLETALDSAEGGYWDLDLRTEKAFFSPMLKQLVGIGDGTENLVEFWNNCVHPDDFAGVSESIRLSIEAKGRRPFDNRHRIRTVNGEYRWVHTRGNVICDRHGQEERLIGICLDVSEKVMAEERIQQLMHYDSVTGLANASTFLRELDAKLATARRKGESMAVGQITIADYSDLLDEYSAKTTEKVVQAVGERINRLTGSDGLAGRLGHDTFAIAAPAAKSAEVAQAAFNSIVDRLDQPLMVDWQRIRPTFDIGAALGPGDGESAHVLIANANRALSRKAASGRDPVQWYTEGLDVESRLRSQRRRALRGAVTRGEFVSHFQPIVGLSSGNTIGFEALARWKQHGEGLVPPDRFISLAEESGCIHEIGAEILRQACHEARSWTERYGKSPFVAVNVSARQLDDPHFLPTVEHILGETGLEAERLELEVTENALVNDFDDASKRLCALRDLGVSIAMDDFGTGYSSLSTLSRLPFNRLKIDRHFVAGYGVDRRTTAIVNATLHLCREMNLDVTAEGIETGGQAVLLGARGVQAAQGYYFSPPLASDVLGDQICRRWPIGTAKMAQPGLVLKRSG